MKSALLAMLLPCLVYAQAIRENLDVDAFDKKYSSKEDAVLLDVRTPGEIQRGYIPGALFIDYNASDFKKKLAALDREKPYFVYCAVGGRSSQTLDIMASMGFKQIYHLEGGFDAWQKAGRKVEKKKP